MPRQHGGTDALDNLALACPYCNAFKGPNLAGFDPLDRAMEPLFHPRQHLWDDHFSQVGPAILGTTAIGRTTVAVLRMNDTDRLTLHAWRST